MTLFGRIALALIATATAGLALYALLCMWVEVEGWLARRSARRPR